MRKTRRKPTSADPAVARESLAALTLFQGASPVTLDRLAAAALEVEVDSGQDVITEGRFPSGFYVVIDGNFEVWSRGEHGGAAVKVNTLGPGSHFGEVGLIEGMPATATVKAAEPARLLKVEGRDLLAVLNDSPRFVREFLSQISGALARTHPSYRLAADAAPEDSSESASVQGLRELANLASSLGPALRPNDAQGLLDSIAAAACRLLNAAACSVALVEDGELVFKGVSGEGAEAIRGTRLGLDRGITGSVFTTGATVAVPDVAKDERFDKSFADSTGYVPKSIHAMRLATTRGPLGVMQVLDAQRLSSDEELEIMVVFAEQAAAAIETESLFENLGRVLLEAAANLVEGESLSQTLEDLSRQARPADAELARFLGLMRRIIRTPADARSELVALVEERLDVTEASN